ncbi:hypothetical protein [Flagellimonas meishanensis]|uniref:hypothetical protein n=1 Tax=Flagellimonas meishanensis TaxID=2873264 RepID=UPI001CA6C288|nr:hypothetical protein [[Muricauda] meishanensis]
MNDLSTNKEHIALEVLIDYVDGILDATSRKKIEEHIKNHPESSEIVYNIKWYYETYGQDREKLEKYLHETKKGILAALDVALEEPSTEHPKVRPLWYRISSVAAIAIFLIIPTVLLLNRTKSKADILEDHLSAPYDNPPITRGEPDQNSMLWNQVALAYGNQNYGGAITFLEAIIDEGETLSMAHFYTGLCYLYLKDPEPDKAIQHLQKVVDGENPFTEPGLWYLSLAHLQNNQESLGRQTLKSITGYKMEEAQKLLAELD